MELEEGDAALSEQLTAAMQVRAELIRAELIRAELIRARRTAGSTPPAAGNALGMFLLVTLPTPPCTLLSPADPHAGPWLLPHPQPARKEESRLTLVLKAPPGCGEKRQELQSNLRGLLGSRL